VLKEENQKIILVNEKDESIGEMGKMDVHLKGLLHRAFSVFIFNKKSELLLQQRASSKYHSRNLWTNTCCSHPKPNESVVQAAQRRLVEEMGMIAEVKPIFSFIYNVPLDNDLTENEFDHVLIGFSEENPQLNLDEAQNYQWISFNSLKKNMDQNPQKYTSWLKIIINEHFDKISPYLNNPS
jgi:isopentenyl-diphosphate delta-isomerase